MPVSSPLLPGEERIGDRYELLERVGGGAAGEVFRAYDHHMDREVALKLLRPRPGEAATWDEARTLERLRSEYLLPVYNADVAYPSDVRYIATEYVSGGDLEKRAKPVGVDVGTAIKWGVRIANGLDRIHDEGLVHRDVKPANVFLAASGDVLLGDMGFAVKMEADGTTLGNGTIVTVAPEVLRTQRCSIATDMYSLAATVFYLICGQYPVDNRGSEREVYDRVASGQRRNIRDLAPHVSQAVGTVIERNLSLRPEDRAQTTVDFVKQLTTAKPHRRAWRLVEQHPGHRSCFSAPRHRLAAELSVCVVPSAHGANFNVEIMRGGRRLRRQEQTLKDSPFDRVPTELRRLIKDLS